MSPRAKERVKLRQGAAPPCGPQSCCSAVIAQSLIDRSCRRAANIFFPSTTNYSQSSVACKPGNGEALIRTLLCCFPILSSARSFGHISEADQFLLSFTARRAWADSRRVITYFESWLWGQNHRNAIKQLGDDHNETGGRLVLEKLTLGYWLISAPSSLECAVDNVASLRCPYG